MTWTIWIVSSLLFYLAPPYITYLWANQKVILKKRYAILLSVVSGYILGNLSTYAKWDYRLMVANEQDPPNMAALLSATADGMNKVFWLYGGWLPVLIYTLLCMLILKFLMRRKKASPE